MRTMEADEFVRRFKSLMADHSDARFVFFLGAGCSVTSGIPAAGALVREWLPRLKRFRTGRSDDWETWAVQHFPGRDTDPAQHYGQVIEELFHTAEERQREIERLTDGKDPGFGYATLAALMSHDQHAPHCNVVLTTNFDDMVSDALYLYTNKKPLVIAHESLAGFIRVSRARPLVVKLHGDARLAPKNTVSETQELNAGVTRAIASILKESGLIFIGYGGNDKTIARILSELPDDALPWGVYWINDRCAGPEMNDWLEKRGAIWVKHLGFDELMLLARNECSLRHPDMSRFQAIEGAYLAAFEQLRQHVQNSTDQADRLSVSDDARDTAASLRSALDRVSTTLDWWKVEQDATKYKESDPDKADEIYRRGIADLAESAELLGNYALFLHQIRKDYDRAEEYYRRAIEADPEDGDYLSNYALFLYQIRKDYDRAEEYYRRAIEADPSDGDILANYAGLLFKRGRDTEARGVVKQAEDVGPTEPALVEMWFYRYAHVRSERANALRELKRLLMLGARSPGWELSVHVERAVGTGHPAPELLQALATVIADNAPVDILELFAAWQAI